jgi:hypothetical protein
MEIHTVQPLEPDPSPLEVETSTAKLKRYKLPGTDQIPTKLTQAGSEHFVMGSTNSLILLGTASAVEEVYCCTNLQEGR